MKLVSVTKKGQVTIPEEVRRKLGIEPGAKLIVESVGSELALLKKVEIMDSLEELQRYCRKLAKRKGLTLKDIEEEIEAARAEIWKEKYEKRLGGL
ncbi:MAG: AbrB/MazE/SpoVT family DNA-binding domain-containing protein [Candidatus Hodarchaeaceae archaeon]|nr:AbrB/MazE/SpoVT family DNA-binding domain-containing protein [Candidatus Hodarchaeaceae archaeon]